MGYRHSREDILDAAIAVALEHGMAALTFSKVGERLAISDRTLATVAQIDGLLLLRRTLGCSRRDAAAGELGLRISR